MTSVSASHARRRLDALIAQVLESHEPLQITSRRGNAVLLAEADWRAIQETLHLVSIPGFWAEPQQHGQRVCSMASSAASASSPGSPSARKRSSR